jgi:micrococcal nuclease
MCLELCDQTLPPVHGATPLMATPPIGATMLALILCLSPFIIDGDTLDCNGTRIRLAHINAPEIETKAGIASRSHLISITRTKVTCVPYGFDKYQRTLADCFANDLNISASLIRNNHARLWRK